jgi:hypothetical protein
MTKMAPLVYLMTMPSYGWHPCCTFIHALPDLRHLWQPASAHPYCWHSCYYFQNADISSDAGIPSVILLLVSMLLLAFLPLLAFCCCWHLCFG